MFMPGSQHDARLQFLLGTYVNAPFYHSINARIHPSTRSVRVYLGTEVGNGSLRARVWNLGPVPRHQM